MKLSKRVCSLIRQSLKEDVGTGDITTHLLVPNRLSGDAYIDAKGNGILCGGAVVKEVFQAVDSKLKVVQQIPDGSAVSKGKKIFRISGNIKSILRAERTALNFLSHLSGIASAAHQYAEKVKGTKARIYDTRKTTPLWRELEKSAVLTGGARNHRFGLWDEVLVKDNHWDALGGVAKSSVLNLKQKLRSSRVPVEIEVTNVRELNRLLEAQVFPDRILLDNFSVPELKKAVKLVKRKKPGIALEASGGVTLNNVRQIAKTGVDRISIGALTHSVLAVDFSLTVSQIRKRS